MLSRGFAIGRLFGTDIYATVSFFLLVAFIFWQSGGNYGVAAILCLALTISIITHEFGHVFAVRWLLKGPCVVILWFLGGVCLHEPTRARGKQVAISLMGPAFGFLLCGLAWLAQRFLPSGPPALGGLLAALVWINLLLSVLNLLPIWPLDGGQALRSALAAKIGGGRAALWTRRVSVVTAVAGAIVGLQLGYHIMPLVAIMLIVDNLFGRGPTHG
jgi:Zn-dependent protease